MPPPALSLALLHQVNQLADRFEAAWCSDTPPTIEAYLRDIAEEARPELLRRLLRIEIEHRWEVGMSLAPAEARQRFVDFGSWVGDVLESLGLEESATLTLEVIAGPAAGRSFDLTGHSAFLVGRGPGGVQLALEGDPRMSRVHFLIEYNPPRARLADLRSRNGTSVNGVKVTETDLRDGDEVRAGQTILRVRMPQGSGTVAEEEPASLATVHPFPPPRALPKVPGYVLEDELGKGGMGVVYRARRASDGLTVALKTVLPAVAPRSETLARFQREMQILQRLSHPNIVRFLDSGSYEGVLWFAMEHVEGISAASYIKYRTPLPEGEVVALGCQLLDALAHAHLQGIVHRDVKPGNLLISPSEGKTRLKLADFGLSRVYHESAMSGLTTIGTPGGTPGFMAPEQVTDFRSARPAADQFGAAATMYFLLTGETVYERVTNTLDQFHQVLNLEPIPLRQPAPGPALPGKLGDVLRRALARDPRRRFADVLAMRDALRAVSG